MRRRRARAYAPEAAHIPSCAADDMASTISDTPRDAGLETARTPLNGAADVVLRDGSTVHVRPTVPADVEAVATFLEGLSADARWFRFLGGGISSQRAARGLVGHGVGLVATAGADEQQPRTGGRGDRVSERDGAAAALAPVASGDDRPVHDGSSWAFSAVRDGPIPR
jgi:hypothetical protein